VGDTRLAEALREPAWRPSGRGDVESAGWMVDGRASSAPLRLVDCSSVTKFEVQADPAGALAGQLAVAVGHVELFEAGILGASPAPGEWDLFVPGATDGLLRLLEGAAREELVSVVDVTHGRALLRLSGAEAPRVLSSLCGLDLGPASFPTGRVTVAPVAGARTLVLRDDLFADEFGPVAGGATRGGPDGGGDDDVPSYLLCCDRSVGRWLTGQLLAAGAPFGLEEEGYLAHQARRDEG
jgi:heterotetrameric sarcosine oxidase gamma subunit